uniref:Homologous recombination OB-fold protein OB-fold domain-containing protein n=1 Tax=Tanacetum cinerariifolium TaxID=118510 RepID=A0A6L2MW20_TANCI|nr:hypothetical protein [Tanacetum cinerariifolium]
MRRTFQRALRELNVEAKYAALLRKCDALSNAVTKTIIRTLIITHVETSTPTQKPVRIIPGPTGIVQAAKLLKEIDILLGCEGAVMTTLKYMKKFVEDVGEDEDFKSGSWVSGTNYVNANGGFVSGCLGEIKNFLNNGKLEKVVAIVKSCSLNVIGDLTVTMKDLSDTIPGTMHHKVIDEGGYGKDITVRATLILANVLVFLLNHQCITLALQ